MKGDNKESREEISKGRGGQRFTKWNNEATEGDRSGTPEALPWGWISRQAADSAQWGEEKSLPTARRSQRMESGPAISRMLFHLPTFLPSSDFLLPVLLLAGLMLKQRNWAEV